MAAGSPGMGGASPLAGLLFLGLSALVLTGCNSSRPGTDSSSNEIYGAVSSLDLSARFGSPVGANDQPRESRPRGITYVGGASSSPGGAAHPDGEAGGDGYEVEFDNAPIPAVAKAIIVDALGLSLNVDPRVDGKISLSAGRPLKRQEVLVAFENALKTNGAAMVKEGAGYRIIPSNDTSGVTALERGRTPAPGYGISVLPLRYVSSENVLKIIESFAVKPGAVRVDSARNLLLVQGTSEERRLAMETALSFDQDWMRGQSVGVYPVVNATPETLITELQRIMDTGEAGVAKGLVQFQAIARMNAIMVVSRNSDALKQVATWIQRLDRADNSASLSKVYHVKYGNARQLAALLNDALGGSGNSSSGASNDSLEPGTGRVSLASSGSSGSFGSSSSSSSLSGSSSANSSSSGSNPFGSLFNRNGANSSSASGNPQSPTDTTSAARNQPSDSVATGSTRGPSAGRFRVTADPSTNSLLIFADRENYRMIQRVLQELDRPRLQVAIEATIAEVSLNDSLQYGVQYFLKSGNLPNVPADRGSIGFTNATSDVLGKVLPGFNFLLGPQTDPRLVLDALHTKTNVKVLSTPSVVVQDNQVASIQVGDQVPVATTQATLVGPTSTGLLTNPAFPVANNIDYRNTGVILRVLPRVSSQGNVSLEIEQEISNVANNGSQGSLTPTVSQRHIKSSIAVTSGQTVVLAGLISNRETGGREGIPFLSNISLLGDLFAHNQTAKDRTELIVFIRPQIIADSIDAQAVAEEMRAKMLLSGGINR